MSTPPPVPTQAKIITKNGRDYVDTFYQNENGDYVSIAQIPIGAPFGKVITIDGQKYIYIYYYQTSERFNTLGRIPIYGDVITPPPPPPPGEQIDPNGVKTIYPKVGSYNTTFTNPSPSNSMRWRAFPKAIVNFEMTGYFKGGGTNTVDIKLHGGAHNKPDDRNGACCYIPTVPLRGGDTYLRTECPHPDYRDCTPRSGAQSAKSLGNIQWRGWKGMIWNKANGGVHIEVWEDQGNNDGAKPANQWILLFKHDHNPGQTCGRFSSPLLGPRSGPDNHECTFRIDDNSNTLGRWLSVVEIVPPSQS